ncbi:hypothetical protein SDC9_186080 [bioreactor metagenome]|uniref:Uncharacterized protein n=1 Tax=bioreactor metagenome TaxID=1076179 RepID=A0A645HIW5_9ZZZZ
MEGTHGQLCTGLTDGLCGDDAHRFADDHRAAVGKVCTVAFGTAAMFGAAAQYAAQLHLFDAGVHHAFRVVVVHHFVF